MGTFLIPVLRTKGTYGYVTADVISRGISALPNGVDYTVPNTSVAFQHGQNRSFINIWITDDEERYDMHTNTQHVNAYTLL